MTIPYLRLATNNDVPAIMTIIEDARQFLHDQKIPQWLNGHPGVTTIQGDVAQKIGYVLIVDGQIAGYTALWQGSDPNYQQIDGAWATDSQHYTALHRVAISSAFRGRHLASFLITNLVTLSYERGYRDVRIDTHELNQPMQHVIASAGFKYRGIITILRDGSPRRAYQMLLN